MLEPTLRLTKDLKEAAATLSTAEARYLVDAYYQMQHDRIRADAQIRSQEQSQEPHEVLGWLGSQTASLEGQIRRALGAYSKAHRVGQWAESITGIGPVISAGLLAHIDITKAPTVGHIWRFGGYDPTTVWAPKTKRPWNASLKTLFWKIGESFVKVSGREADIYGKVYTARKAKEIEKSDSGCFADQAAAMLSRKKFRDETAAKKVYESGKLPPAHLHARAKRYAVKLFISHWHEVEYFIHYGNLPPKPYIMTVEHGHNFIEVPNMEIVPGLAEARIFFNSERVRQEE